MGMIRQVICLFFGHFIVAHTFMTNGDTMFFHDFGGFFENELFPPERYFDFLPFDDIFSSWPTWTPEFNMLAEFPPFINIPRVQVSCDESKLTVLVDKQSFGLTLTAEEIQLGDGCYSTGELMNQFAFVYGLEECGTTPVLQNGLQAFTNSLHLNLKTLPTSWQTPPTVYISCIPRRLHNDPRFTSTFPVNAPSFNIQAVNPSWTEVAQSNIYTRGQVINLQVTAKTRPDQQLFIQSCFTSASPEPHTRPRHAVILNKGCSSSLGTPHAIAQFTASNRADVVNFILNTTNLISELYIHCSVLLSDNGITSATKSCNYNATHSRWEELSGDVEVCSCCSSKCKGSSMKNLPDDAKAVITMGPLVILDNERRNHALKGSESQMSTSVSNGLTSSGDLIVSGTSISQSKHLPSPQGVVVVSQDPTARLTLWLPGQVQRKCKKIISQSEDGLSGQLPSDCGDDLMSQPLTENKEALKSQLANDNTGQTVYNGGSSLWDMTLHPVVDGWSNLENPGKALLAEEFQGNRFGRSGNSDSESAQDDLSQPPEISINFMFEQPKPVIPANVAAVEESTKKWVPAGVESNDFNQRADLLRDEPYQPQEDAEMPEDINDQPIIRSKLEYSKSADGSQVLSYEEEMKQQEGKCAQGRPKRGALKEKWEPGLKGLQSTFLYLMRRMNKAE